MYSYINVQNENNPITSLINDHLYFIILYVIYFIPNTAFFNFLTTVPLKSSPLFFKGEHHLPVSTFNYLIVLRSLKSKFELVVVKLSNCVN